MAVMHKYWLKAAQKSTISHIADAHGGLFPPSTAAPAVPLWRFFDLLTYKGPWFSGGPLFLPSRQPSHIFFARDLETSIFDDTYIDVSRYTEMSTMDRDEIFKALSSPVRRQILEWLKDPQAHFGGKGHVSDFGVCAGGFECCGLSQSTVSAHLATLQRAGLIEAEKVGQWIYYRRNETLIEAFRSEVASSL
jgi:DNA-binding transcriptional ArsR family regulator